MRCIKNILERITRSINTCEIAAIVVIAIIKRTVPAENAIKFAMLASIESPHKAAKTTNKNAGSVQAIPPIA